MVNLDTGKAFVFKLVGHLDSSIRLEALRKTRGPFAVSPKGDEARRRNFNRREAIRRGEIVGKDEKLPVHGPVRHGPKRSSGEKAKTTKTSPREYGTIEGYRSTRARERERLKEAERHYAYGATKDPSNVWDFIDDDDLERANQKNIDEMGYKPVSAEEYLNSKGKGEALAAAQKKDADKAASTAPSRPAPPIPRPEGAPSRPPVDLTNREKLMERLRGGGDDSAATQAPQASSSVVDDAAKMAPTAPGTVSVSNSRTFDDTSRVVSGVDSSEFNQDLGKAEPFDKAGTVKTSAAAYKDGPSTVSGVKIPREVQATTKGKVGLSEMLASGKVGRNALAGAAVGAVLGGLNPAGDDGLIRGGMGGALVGATMGGLAAAANSYMNPDGTDMVSKGGRLFPSVAKDGTPVKPGKAGMLMSLGGVVGGVMGGLIGGSGKGKRHNTIDSNGWSRGTHPAYF
jgi:hypothetical protein